MPSIFRSACAVLVWTIIAGAPAFADIKAFNAAVKAGDYKSAAAEAKAVWQTWDRKNPQTALIAREFGFAALVSGDNEFARSLGAFLVQDGKTLATPDDQPRVSAVLKAIAEFKLARGGDAERAALREALSARSGDAGIDMTSVLSWQALYIADWNRYDWANVTKDGLAAADFMKRQPGSFAARQREAEIAVAAADFISGRARQTWTNRAAVYDAMADLHDAIVADIDAATSPSLRDQLWDVKWRAEAWTGAIESYMNSTYAQIGSNISTAIRPRKLASPKFSPVAEDPATVATPLCEGRFEGRKVQYPEAKAFEGMVGSVIVRIETGADGRVSNTQMLAAVPVDGFGDRVLEAVKDWRYKPKSTSGCRLNSRNHIYHVQFVIGR